MQGGTGTSELVVGRPAPRLRPVVDRYLGYRMTGFDPALHRGLPSRHMTFIVSIGSPIDVVAQTDPTQAPAAYRFVLSGLQAGPALIAHAGTQEGVAIALTPLGSRTLLHRPARDLFDVSVECADVAGRLGDQLWERLQEPASWQHRFAVCDEVLSTIAGDARVPRELDHCWRGLVASGGRATVAQLADATGYSRQHLTRRFRAEFGLGPKLAARVVRFERAHHLLTTDPARSVPAVAAACGYYDQSHLHRDVTILAGCTPAELRAGDVPIVQDADLDVR